MDGGEREGGGMRGKEGDERKEWRREGRRGMREKNGGEKEGGG